MFGGNDSYALKEGSSERPAATLRPPVGNGAVAGELPPLRAALRAASRTLPAATAGRRGPRPTRCADRCAKVSGPAERKVRRHRQLALDVARAGAGCASNEHCACAACNAGVRE